MDLKEPHVPFVNQSGIFDWEHDRLENEYRLHLFPPSILSLQGSLLYDSSYMTNDILNCPPLICRPDLHQDHVATAYTLYRPMPSSYNCLLDPTRRLHEKPHLDELGDNVTVSIPGLTRFDRDPPLSFDLPKLNSSLNKEQLEYTWYHNNETEIGKIFPENYWNRHKLAGTSPSAYLVPTVL
ncbi:unnamed protein product [Rotaria sp. Silwood2]|nr:unnamed protein product [Rotaria sp. Silwood2]CAF2883297.1 unnamed protein product [Rotaria sp. Silwood2]CAF3034946.1 unnamed protein product [Rotaria sp. Silwood2]CAF3944463.1 unnamed protein product [Rotaria sp. Silwood2]CAF4363046.1 unnamed protein product [Rotaria sp. Silwood2]